MSPFRALDLLTFGLPAAGMTVLAAWLSFSSESWEAKAVTWACAAGFVLIYGLLVYHRWRASRRR